MKTYTTKVLDYTINTDMITEQDAIEYTIYELAQDGITVTANDITLVLEQIMRFYVVHVENDRALSGDNLDQLLATAKENNQEVIYIDEWVSMEEQKTLDL